MLFYRFFSGVFFISLSTPVRMGNKSSHRFARHKSGFQLHWNLWKHEEILLQLRQSYSIYQWVSSRPCKLHSREKKLILVCTLFTSRFLASLTTNPSIFYACMLRCDWFMLWQNSLVLSYKLPVTSFHKPKISQIVSRSQPFSTVVILPRIISLFTPEIYVSWFQFNPRTNLIFISGRLERLKLCNFVCFL